MTKAERVKLIKIVLDDMFSDAYCELNHSNNLELIIAVLLSAQTTDLAVNKLTADLFKKYRCLDDYLNCDIKQLENDLKTIGLYKNKAKSIKGLCAKLKNEFNGEVPSTLKALQSLPGVGRKTANVVLSVAFDVPTFAVDTHVERISKRLGLAKKDDSVLKVEMKLKRAFDRSDWNRLHHQLIFFGRYHCKAQSPNCFNCPLEPICKMRAQKIKISKKEV